MWGAEDYAMLRAISFLRRYAMKPKPAKPRIIIAHVESSGTASTGLASRQTDGAVALFRSGQPNPAANSSSG
jgi:hypothetical protein